MSTLTLKSLSRQVEQLSTEDQLALLALLVENLRREMQPQRRPLGAYYGLGAGQRGATRRVEDLALAL